MLRCERTSVCCSRSEVRHLGTVDYQPTWQAMRAFTDTRTPDTPDELWVLEHPPVYTLGQAGKREHLLNADAIPVVETDRGGQVTYHGPGQLVVYTLIDLRRAGYSIRDLVVRLENAIIETLDAYGVSARGRRDAPGVYVDGAKIAALGLRVRRGCTYHGLSLNIDVDLAPFAGINPCGYAGLEVVSTRSLGVVASRETVVADLLKSLHAHL